MPKLLPQHKQVEKICKQCSKRFSVFPYRKKEAKFCSKKCYWVSIKGVRFCHEYEIRKGQRLSPKTEFKGNSKSYYALHEWIRRHFPKISKCEFCFTETAAKYEWANKSHQYKRDTEDWIRLCVPCHRKYDWEHRKKNGSSITKKYERAKVVIKSQTIKIS